MTGSRIPPTELLASLLAPPPPRPAADVATWWQGEVARRRADPDASAFERAIAGGLAADRLGWALASGYQAALSVLIPDLPGDAPVAFCVSEEGGNAPRAIRSVLAPDGDGYRLSGEKRWSTLGPAAGWLLVAAREGQADPEARPAIRLVRVAGRAAGVEFIPMPEARFVPEVPHARIRLADVRVEPDAVFPGDGYARYVKPFRSIEDVLVTAAELAYLLAEAGRRGWPRSWREQALALLLGFEALTRLDHRASPMHVALAGVLTGWRALAAEAGTHFAQGPADDAAARWARDSELFEMRFAARTVRTERAWQQLDG